MPNKSEIASKQFITCDSTTGRIPPKTAEAMKRMDARVSQLEGQGVAKEEAVKQAFKEMRDNPSNDWRKG